MGPAREQLDWVVDVLRRGTLTTAEVEERFDERFLAAVPPAKVVDVLSALSSPDVEAQEVVDDRTSLRAAVGTMLVTLSVEDAPPHRMTGLMLRPRIERLTDERLAEPTFSGLDDAPPALAEAFRAQWEKGEVPGLVAGAAKGSTTWTMSAGWADVESATVVTPDQTFPAYSVTKLVTTVAVLQLVGEGLLGLDDPANHHLRSLRLAEDAATVRQLLTHTAGVSSSFEHWVEKVPDSVREVLGDVAAHDFAPGTDRQYSNGGFAVLGQLVEDVRGAAFADVVTERVLQPLGMDDSSFPTTHPGRGALGHVADDEGRLAPAPPVVPSVPPAGGMWSTVGDLLRLATGWSSVLPDDVAEEAITPQVDRGGGAWSGLGFLVTTTEPTVIGHAGGGVGYGSSLLAVPEHEVAAVVLVNRQVGAEPMCIPILQALRDVD